jgi:hypothetical protein
MITNTDKFIYAPTGGSAACFTRLGRWTIAAFGTPGSRFAGQADERYLPRHRPNLQPKNGNHSARGTVAGRRGGRFDREQSGIRRVLLLDRDDADHAEPAAVAVQIVSLGWIITA